MIERIVNKYPIPVFTTIYIILMITTIWMWIIVFNHVPEFDREKGPQLADAIFGTFLLIFGCAVPIFFLGAPIRWLYDTSLDTKEFLLLEVCLTVAPGLVLWIVIIGICSLFYFIPHLLITKNRFYIRRKDRIIREEARTTML